MSLREALTLSPYQKWTRYRQLPTKVILHLLVALLSASLQIIQGEAMESTMQFTKRDLEHLIYPADCVSQWRGLPQYSAQVQQCRVRTIEELREVLSNCVDTAFEMEQLAVSSIKPVFDGERAEPEPHVVMKAWFLGSDPQPASEVYPLTNATVDASLGPLSSAEPWRDWLDSVERIELSFDISDTLRLSSLFYPAVSTGTFWRVIVQLEPVKSRTSLLLSSRMHQLSTSDPPVRSLGKIIVFAALATLNLLSLLLAVRSTVLALYRLNHLTTRFEYAGQLGQSPQPTPGSSPTPGSPLVSGHLPNPSSVQPLTLDGNLPSTSAAPVPQRPPPGAMQRATTAPLRCAVPAGGDPSSSGSSSHSPAVAGPNGGTNGGTNGSRRPSLLQFGRRLTWTKPVAAEVVDEAAWLANLHIEYPFLDAGRVVGGASGDVVADTLKEARAWIKKPFHIRLASLLSFFVCVDVIGNLCLLGYAWMTIVGVWEADVTVFNPRSADRGLSAFGSLCVWFGLIRYFGHSRRLQLVTTTLTTVASPIAWTLVSVLPIFIGYALAGIQLFGDYAPGFASFSIACSTLWALMAGDEVNNTFRQVSPFYPAIGRLYVYTFMAIFYLAIANIFIVLIESAYMISLSTHYKTRGEGTSKTRWSELGVEFARYARKLVQLYEGAAAVANGPPSRPGSAASERPSATGDGGGRSSPIPTEEEALGRRLASLEESMKRQGEMLQRLLAAQQSSR